mgnify:CR=1 FL=1
MTPESIDSLLAIIADNPGTIIAALLPQVVTLIATYVRIERRITRLETIINLSMQHRAERPPSILAPVDARPRQSHRAK